MRQRLRLCLSGRNDPPPDQRQPAWLSSVLHGGGGASSSARQVSGQLVSYLVEMGVDPRIFAKASSQGADDMYWVPEGEAEEFDLITPNGYAAFFLEPYGKGVVAAAKRKTPPGPNDTAHQITAYCRAGCPSFCLPRPLCPTIRKRSAWRPMALPA